MTDRRKDLEWLYRQEQDHAEPTAVLSPAQQASLSQPYYRSQGEQAAGQPLPPQPGYRPTPQPQQPTPYRPQPQNPASSYSPSQPRPRKKRHLLRKVFTLLPLAWLIFLIATPLYAWIVGTAVDAFPRGERPAAQPGSTILLVGSDARSDLSTEDRARLGTGTTEGGRTDTMMLLHTPTRGKPVLLSLPRDSFVEIPGKGKNKLNAAYAFGGSALLIETIEKNTGIHIDGYVEIGFLGIVDLVDAVGGIRVCPSFDINDQDSHLKMSAGCQDVDGVTALGYVRMRKADPRGDLGRVDRQREVVSALSKKLISPMSIINPISYWRINMAASKSLTRSKETDLGQITQVVQGMFSVMSGSGLSLTVPVSNADAHTSAGSAVIWDAKASKKIFHAIAAGDTTTLGS